LAEILKNQLVLEDFPSVRTLWGKPKKELSKELKYLIFLGRKDEEETEKKN